MKKSLIKTMAVCVSLLTVLSQTPIVADNNTVTGEQSGQISSVYNYDNSPFSGTYSTIFNTANGSLTHVYSNGSISGHQPLNGSGQIDTTSTIFIPTSISYYNAGGTLAATSDPITNTYQTYDFSGRLQTSYSVIQDPTSGNTYYYVNTVNYQTGGSYDVVASGAMVNEKTNDAITIDNFRQAYNTANGTSLSDADVISQFVAPTWDKVNATSAQLNNLENNVNSAWTADPFPFETSDSHYDATGKLLYVTTYALQAGSDGNGYQTQAAGRVVYSYTGTTVTQDITYQYASTTDPATGNVTYTPYTSDPKTGAPVSGDTSGYIITQVEQYTGGNRTSVIKPKPGIATPDNNWSNYADSGSDYYLSQQYVYNGVKLDHMNTFDDSTGTSVLSTITYYDPFGRETEVIASRSDTTTNPSGVDRVAQTFVYNDSETPISALSYDGQHTATCVQGGLQYAITYNYDNSQTGATDPISTDTEFFVNGDQTKPAFGIHTDNPTAVAELLQNSSTGNLDWASDVTTNAIVSGTITLGGTAIGSTATPSPDGTLVMAINDPTTFLNMIDSIQASITTYGISALQTVITALTQQWNSSGGSTLVAPASGQTSWAFEDNSGNPIAASAATAGNTSVKLGVINLPGSVPASGAPTTEYVGNATTYQANGIATEETGIYNSTSYTTLFNWAKALADTQAGGKYNNPIAVNLTCNYWAVDSTGNIWVFANAGEDGSLNTIF